MAVLVAEGVTNREIAAPLFIAERTAEGHVEQIRNKLAFTPRSQIAAWGGRAAPVGARRGAFDGAPATAIQTRQIAQRRPRREGGATR